MCSNTTNIINLAYLVFKIPMLKRKLSIESESVFVTPLAVV